VYLLLHKAIFTVGGDIFAISIY